MLHEDDHGGDEREPGDRETASAPVLSQGPLRRLGRCASGGPALQHYSKHPHRLSDVLNRLLAEVLVAQSELVLDLVMDGARDADAARVGKTFEARGDVDAIAVDLLAIHHHVTEVDADAEFHPLLGRDIRVLGVERGLNLDGALDRVHDAGELGEYAVAGGIDESPAMLLDEPVNQFAVGGKSAEGRLLVLPHEAAIAEDVGTEYGGELTFQNPPRGATDNRANPAGCQRAGLSNQTRPNSNINYEGSGFPRAAVVVNSGNAAAFPNKDRVSRSAISHRLSSSRRVLASFRSAVSKPSVNQL